MTPEYSPEMWVSLVAWAYIISLFVNSHLDEPLGYFGTAGAIIVGITAMRTYSDIDQGSIQFWDLPDFSIGILRVLHFFLERIAIVIVCASIIWAVWLLLKAGYRKMTS